MQLCYRSFRELKSISAITGCALLMALNIVLSYFSVYLTASLQISFEFIATALMGMIYGPVCAGLTAGIGDILSFIIKPTGTFFPGFTLNAMLAGIIFGFAFYKNEVSIPRVIIAKASVNIFINIILNTLWLSILLGQGFFALLIPRITKNLVLLPVECILLYVVLKQIARLSRKFPDLIS